MTQIANSESGLSVRNKLNDALSKVNTIALITFENVSELIADTTLSYTEDTNKFVVVENDLILAGRHFYRVASNITNIVSSINRSGYHVTNANGVKFFIEKENGFYNYAAFGPAADNSTDDTAVLQRAVDTGESIMFPSITSLIEGSITVDAGGQAFVTAAQVTPSAGNTNVTTTRTPVTVLTRAKTDGTAMFVVRNTFATFKGIGFDGGNKTNSQVAILIERTDSNTDDVDVDVEDCRFKSFGVGIECVGRALKAHNNLFAQCGSAIKRRWPTSGVDSTPTNQQGLPFGWRADRISFNRAHSTDLLLEVPSSEAGKEYVGLQLHNNMLDLGEKLITSECHMVNWDVSHNYSNSANSTIIYHVGSVSGSSFVGNKFGGKLDDGVNTPAWAYWFDLSDTDNLFDLSILGGSIRVTDNGGIRIRDTGTGSATVDGLDISHVSTYVVGAGGSTNAFLSSDFSISNLVMTGNTARDGTVSPDSSVDGNAPYEISPAYLVNLNSNTLSNSSIFGNRINYTTDLVNGTVDDTNFVIDGAIRVGNSGNVIPQGDIVSEHRVTLGTYSGTLRQFNVATDNSRVAKIERTDGAGVGIEFIGTGGTVSIFATPSGSEAGHFSPAGIGNVSLGNTSQPWQEFYGTSLVIEDGIAAPATISGFASIYVDSADGDLKIKFADGTVKTIVTDT
jgi:hypothetical protein